MAVTTPQSSSSGRFLFSFIISFLSMFFAYLLIFYDEANPVLDYTLLRKSSLCALSISVLIGLLIKLSSRFMPEETPPDSTPEPPYFNTWMGISVGFMLLMGALVLYIYEL